MALEPVTFDELNTLKGSNIDTTLQAQIDAIGSTITLDDGKIFVGSAANVPTDVSLTGGVTITNTGLATLGPNNGYTTTATAATTTTLTVASTVLQYFTGSTTQTVVLPVTSTLALGWKIRVVNNSSGLVTVNSSGSNLVSTVSPGSCVEFTCILISGTSAASWSTDFNDSSSQTGAGWFNNLAIVSATTTNAGDSVKITSADGSALSATNFGTLSLPSVTAGQRTLFTITANVTILLTGATWGNAGLGDLAGALLRVLAVNDNGTVKWGVALVGGRNCLLTTDTTATPASVTTPEGILCSSAIGSATNSCQELGFVRANFDDTGGAAEDLWAIQTGINDIYTGIIADGYWQPWNPSWTGFSADPTNTTARWTQYGRTVKIEYAVNAPGTSNSTSYTQTVPVKARVLKGVPSGAGTDLATPLSIPAYVRTTVGSVTLNLFGNIAEAPWTAAGNKAANFSMDYEAGPAASFLE